MDFEVEQKGFTQFMYVLPFSSTTALVELTRFGAEIVCETAAEKQLQDYIYKHFGEFKKHAIEIGCIPMSNAEIINNELKDVRLGQKYNGLLEESFHNVKLVRLNRVILKSLL